MNFGDMIEIKDISGKTRFSTPINKGAKGKFTLMKEDYIILPFSVAEPIPFKLGDYVDLAGVLDESLGGKLAKIYEIIDIQKPTYNTSTGGYEYELRLDAYYWKWKNKIFKYTPEHAGSEASWSLTATLDIQLGVFLRNLKALGYAYRGEDFTFSIDDTVENKAIAMTYDNMNLLDALFSMAGEDKWNCDCWITDNVIHFGRNEFGDAIKIERGVEASDIIRSESQGTYATRIYAFGSTKNIPTNYRPTDEQAVVNGVVQKRLMLPADTPYIDAYEGMSQEEAIEDVVVFDDVYPRRIGSLSDVHTRTEEVKNEDGTKETVIYYRYKDIGLEFKKEYIIEGQELQITFQSGKLNGMVFGVIFNPSPKDESRGEQLWEIVRNEDYGRPLPDDIIRPENEDKYILSGFNIQLVSDQYIPEAEQELKEKAQKYADKAKKDDGTYPTTLRSSWVYEDPISRTFEFGQRINLIDDTYFENGRISRVLGWEIKLDIPWDSPSYTIGESMPYSRIGDIEDKVDFLTYKGQTYTGGASGVYLIKVNDSTAASESNAYSALRSLKTFLRKDAPDETSHLINFIAGAQFKDTIEAVKALFDGDIGSRDYAEGTLGWNIQKDGAANMRSLRLLEFLEAPEYRFNHVEVIAEELWSASGGGIIKSVDTDNQIITLKLDSGDVASIEVDDICKSIYNYGTGFKTCFFRIVECIDEEQFKYSLRSGTELHPSSFMHFVAYGNFTKKARQRSAVYTTSYARYLKDVNDWDITSRNIAMQLGDLDNLRQLGIDMTGYSGYLKNIYLTGTVRQLSADGVTEVPIPCFKGVWVSGTPYYYYDEVTHDGSTWTCINHESTTQEPSDTATDWLKRTSKGDTGAPGKDGEKGETGPAGPQGEKGDTGPQGIQGPAGKDGRSTYFHIKYSMKSSPTSASDMTETPSDYIGTYVDFSEADSTDPAAYTWARFKGLQGAKGDQGIPGTNGANGQTSYLHIKYSNDGGTTFTGNNGELPGAYIGQYVDFTQADSSDLKKYTWSKIQGEQGPRGLQGLQGEKGEQGIPGPKGETGASGTDGKTSYFHIKYSNDGGKTFTSNNGEDVGDWMGTYVDFTQSDSSSVSAYKWMKTKGAQGVKGDQGIPGTNGTNGQTSYLHIAYANSADGSSGFSTSDSINKLYIGQYTDFTQADSADYKKYSWSRIKGDKGDTGPTGSQGIPGTSSYFHIKYSANSNGNPMSDTPNTYIGTAVTQSSTAPTSYTSYKWARFQGTQGPKGDQGIQGPTGVNGKTSYLHIKYSDDGGKTFTANNGETPGAYIGQYVDFTQADSSSISSYTWTKVKGDKGDKGDKGETGSTGVGIKSVDVLYYMSTSATSLSGGSWQTTSPEWVNGKYIWSKTKVTYTNNSTKETSPVCITGAKGNTGATGNTGAAGKGVKSIVEEYYLSTSSSSPTGGSWSTTVPVWQNGKYIWTRSVITYTDNSKTTTNAVCVSGSKGDKGETGAAGSPGRDGSPGKDGVGVSTVDVLYYLSASSTTVTGGSWSTTAPTWVNGKYMWSKTKVTYTDGKTKETAAVCITGAKGDKGSTGTAGKGVKSIVEQYYLSTSNTSQAGGSWVSTPPAWASGKYIWTRSVITYTDNTSTTTQPVCVSGSKGDKGDTGSPGKDGIQGPQGKMLRPRGTWKASTAYKNDSQYRDVVIYNGQNYICKTSHTSGTSWSSTNWESFNEFINVATQVLLAENAYIDLLQGNSIQVMNSSGKVCAGLSGVNDYPLFVGSDLAGRASAPFRVSATGEMTCKGANVEGVLKALAYSQIAGMTVQNNFLQFAETDKEVRVGNSVYPPSSSMSGFIYLKDVSKNTFGRRAIHIDVTSNKTATVGDSRSYSEALHIEHGTVRVNPGNLMDVPGLLFAGRFSYNGDLEWVWGKGEYKIQDRWGNTVNSPFWRTWYNQGGQKWTYIHHNLGHYNYGIALTMYRPDSNWNRITARVGKLEETGFEIIFNDITQDNKLIDSAYFFAVFGENK